MSPYYVGVDWSSGSWVAVAYSEQSGAPEVQVYDTIRDIWTDYEESDYRIVVDVPIGLCESLESDDCPCVEEDGELSRECDDLARTAIGPRHSSVFTTPAREATRKATDEGIEYDDVNALNRELTGKGLMRQAANISKGIVEVEQLLLEVDGQDVLVEGHPEVCFRAFSGDSLGHSKKYAPGVDERLEALETVAEYEEGQWRELARDLHNVEQNIRLDDVLDALALALTAHAPDEELQRLPKDPPPEDAKGLPMQMVYRAKDPFDIEN